jgi:photosystem II stability/assembly factor-like uncharacterized protein
VGAALLVGTRKGLFVVREDGDEWTVDEPLLRGWSVYHAVADPRDGVLHACTKSFAYGATLHRSRDRGRTWERPERLELPAESGLELEATWHVEPGRSSEPDTLWLGGDPGALLRSDDGGATWSAVEGILGHPTRDRWNPGAGGLCCHSIQIADGRLYVAISAAGTFRSDDGGETWEPINSGVAAGFLPDPYPEVGQCVHKLLAHPARPERLWQQNHCGVYRSDDGGDAWERVDGNGLPSEFGFALALDPSDPDVAYVAPEEGPENRVTCDGRLGVYRTGDGGASWELDSDGLPERAWTGVLRECLASDERGVYLGTQSGSVFVQSREGRWREAALQLPPILSVEVADWS